MELLHFHFGGFSDNPGTGNVPDLGPDLRLVREKIAKRVGKVARATADIFAQRLFGADVDACRAFGRYMIASTIFRAVPTTGRPNPFVFACPPEPPGNSAWRLKTNPAPSLPRKGRGHHLPAPMQEASPQAIRVTGASR